MSQDCFFQFVCCVMHEGRVLQRIVDPAVLCYFKVIMFQGCDGGYDVLRLRWRL